MMGIRADEYDVQNNETNVHFYLDTANEAPFCCKACDTDFLQIKCSIYLSTGI